LGIGLQNRRRDGNEALPADLLLDEPFGEDQLQRRGIERFTGRRMQRRLGEFVQVGLDVIEMGR